MSETDPFQILSSHIAYQNPWITVEHQDVLRPDGRPGIYGIVRFANRAVGVLPIDETGYVWMVGQFRRPVEAWSWEMPEGGVPYEEEIEAGARRELEEEVGVRAETLVKVLEMDLSNSVCDETATCFVAYGLSRGNLDPDATEVLTIKQLHFTQLLAEVEAGKIRDALTVATVYRTYHLAQTNQLPAALTQKMLAHPDGE
ncbi:NUDIX hydrolase [Aquidulcibacter sp.]|uniref:NUDIX domain-containing protein n=1 Tax=Aquidulcibacter sp. TaxID=2052990 RepID=UPI0025BAAE21|nr:NUDIX hydrolase [Aquidulcibacter sp.]MCA3696901.1 NUDIX hydrolase [Aquidulcibacter sp.]